MYGIFINEDVFPFAHAIADRRKPVETRNKNMLKNLYGKRVALISTRRGKLPTICGYATITCMFYYPAEYLNNIRRDTLIPAGSKYDPKPGGGKWCYWMSYPETCAEYTLPENAIRHGRSWCEFSIDG